MDMAPLSLTDRLRMCADLYAATPEGSLSRLGKRAINDGAFFDRIGDRGPTTATLEKLAAFLADPANWPEGEVPQEAIELAHVVGVSPVAVVPDALAPVDADSADGAGRSAGNADESSPAVRSAA
ncbi:hypothetical protein ACWPMX_07920 [Tsuneonella sp. HG094]